MKKLVNISNIQQSLNANKIIHETAVNLAVLSKFGDYGLTAMELAPGAKQKLHYHKYGLIDCFIVIKGNGLLHLTNMENDSVIPESQETAVVTAGDVYCLRPYLLHAIENSGKEPLVYLNFAPLSHVDIDSFYP